MKPLRKRPCHQTIKSEGNRSTIVFCTVCTKGRKPILANSEAHQLLIEAWQSANEWLVGRYTILPDHIHLFAAPATYPAGAIRRWAKYWKSTVSRKWPHPAQQPIWQKDIWDRQLRSGQSYHGKWIYVRENCVRHGLASTSDSWPFQGELNVLPWHDR